MIAARRERGPLDIQRKRESDQDVRRGSERDLNLSETAASSTQGIRQQLLCKRCDSDRVFFEDGCDVVQDCAQCQLQIEKMVAQNRDGCVSLQTSESRRDEKEISEQDTRIMVERQLSLQLEKDIQRFKQMDEEVRLIDEENKRSLRLYHGYEGEHSVSRDDGQARVFDTECLLRTIGVQMLEKPEDEESNDVDDNDRFLSMARLRSSEASQRQKQKD